MLPIVQQGVHRLRRTTVKGLRDPSIFMAISAAFYLIPAITVAQDAPLVAGLWLLTALFCFFSDYVVRHSNRKQGPRTRGD